MVTRRMTPLHRWVANADYAWPRFLAFMVIRLAEIAVLIVLLILVIRWGFNV